MSSNINFPNPITKVFHYGAHKVALETGRIARQATASVLVSVEDTCVLVNVVGAKSKEARDFFPLVVNYQERTYAAGNIPGGYFRREGRPAEHEILISRLIDRPIRPLFPDDFRDEVQVVATVISLNPKISPDIPAIIGASAALALSGLPFAGPLGAARVAWIDGGYVLNPTVDQMKESQLDLVVAGTSDAILMVESEAKELSESVMLDAVMFGHEQMQTVIGAINEFAQMVEVHQWDWHKSNDSSHLLNTLKNSVLSELQDCYVIKEKQQRREAINELLTRVLQQFSEETMDYSEAEIVSAFGLLESEIVRSRVLSNYPRIDGRDLTTVRPITIETGILPRTHGSSLFTRGETQAMVVATLGTERDAQAIDALMGERKETFMLHYNFPPYCVGEVGQIGSPKRREIGHGNLAKRALMAVLPEQDKFGYTLRVVSEITESNGSSSMATVCGTSLALMDAGVPITAPVAGIAMGLVKEGEKFAVLTDILGDEDHLGDMDFKVAGTNQGITALQMDIKIKGINRDIMEVALSQARDGRMHILELMQQTLAKAREDISCYAPKITSFNISPDKIRDVIGKGGATIREIIDKTGVTVDVNDDGLVRVAATDGESAERACQMIRDIVADAEVGQIYEGRVVKIAEFGAFVAFLPNKEGLVHISQIAEERIQAVEDRLAVGQLVNVKVLEIDRQGRVRLTMKGLES